MALSTTVLFSTDEGNELLDDADKFFYSAVENNDCHIFQLWIMSLVYFRPKPINSGL